jgi:hypothetical protein
VPLTEEAHMSWDEAATLAAVEDVLAAMDSELDRPAAHAPAPAAGGFAGRLSPAPPEPALASAQSAPPASDPALHESGSIGHGHGHVRPGGPVVAAAPDDALEGARREILAALSGELTPGAI